MERTAIGSGTSAAVRGTGASRIRLYIVLGAVVALLLFVGFPIGLAALTSRETARDVIIITWGILSIVAFLLLIWLLLVVALSAMRLIRTVNVTVSEDIRPILATTRETANNVTGTTRFVSDSIVMPIIRLYGIIAGVRRWFGIVLGIARRGKPGNEPKRR